MSETPSSEHNHRADQDTYPGDKIFGWTSNKKTGLFVFVGMLVLSAALVIASFILPHRHEYVPIAEFAPFYAIFGFVAFAGVVLSGWPLRKLLGRPENYYEPEETQND